jgi:hypothetical protein
MALHPTSRIARVTDSLCDAAVASARQAVVVFIGSLIVAMAVFGDHTLAGFDFVLSRIDWCVGVRLSLGVELALSSALHPSLAVFGSLVRSPPLSRYVWSNHR